jgi:hypothetical protein
LCLLKTVIRGSGRTTHHRDETTMNRRRILAGAGVALSPALAGCRRFSSSHGRPRGTGSLPVRVWLEEVSLSGSERDGLDPIVFGDLSGSEREIVRTALAEGEFTARPKTDPPGLEPFRDRVEARTGNGETLVVYLRQDGTYYRVGFVDGDHVIAHPDR